MNHKKFNLGLVSDPVRKASLHQDDDLAHSLAVQAVLQDMQNLAAQEIHLAHEPQITI